LSDISQCNPWSPVKATAFLLELYKLLSEGDLHRGRDFLEYSLIFGVPVVNHKKEVIGLMTQSYLVDVMSKVIHLEIFVDLGRICKNFPKICLKKGWNNLKR
jgi:hypothetical protein